MSAIVDVLTEAVIGRPRDEVASFAANPDNAHMWYRNIRSAEWTTPKPLAVGSRIAFEARFLGRTLNYTYELSEYVPGRRLVMRAASGPFPMETTYTWEDAGTNATRMTLRNRGRPAGFSGVFAPFMAMAIRRANKKDLETLKQLLEGR